MSLRRLFTGAWRPAPLHIDLVDSPDRLASALRGLAYFVQRRRDLDGQTIRITLTVRDRQQGEGR